MGKRDVDDRCVQHHHHLGGEDHEEENRGPREQAAEPSGPLFGAGTGGRRARAANGWNGH